MAQLITTKEKYGVSVAARIDVDLAHQIAERAERIGVSFAKMVSMLITKGFNPTEPIYLKNEEGANKQEIEIGVLSFEISQLRDELNKQKSLYQLAAAKFIEELAESKERQIQLANTYNSALKKAKDEIY